MRGRHVVLRSVFVALVVAMLGGLVPAGASAPRPSGHALSLSEFSLDFFQQRVGTFGPGQTVTLTNTFFLPMTISGIDVTGSNPGDYFGTTNCLDSPPVVLASNQTCELETHFGPLARGQREAVLVISYVVDGFPFEETVSLSGQGTEGYYLSGRIGQVGEFGDAFFYGDATNLRLNAPMISITTTANGGGYWLLARDGGIFSFGNAKFYGSTGGMRLNKPVVGMARTRTGKGYWLVASDGGIFAFGDARFFGSTGGMRLNKPVVGMAPTPSGKGYWLVASDGGIFAFGDARFFGSTGSLRLNRPINGMASRPSGKGYWLVASDGGIFAFGDARFYGSTGGQYVGTIVGIATTPDGKGYWLASNLGGVFAFGNAPFLGDLAGVGISDVVGLAGTAPPLHPSLLPFVTPSVGASASTRSLAPRSTSIPFGSVGPAGRVATDASTGTSGR